MAATVALLLMAGSALAAVPTTTDHRNATQPMITGTAMLVNEHQLLVNTEQGEEVLLTLDTRTMVPADIAAGMMMRVEFKFLDDGTRYAERVIPIRSGQKVTRELAYSNEREPTDVQLAGSDETDAMGASSTYESGTMHHGGHAHVAMGTTADMNATRIRARRTFATTAYSATNQPLGTPLRPIPSTDAYNVATQAMIVGEVLAVNDHRLMVTTDQGHEVRLEMDTRTLVPTDLQTGMGVRVEYRALGNGAKLATRVVPVWHETDIATADMTGQEIAYASTDQMVAQNEMPTDHADHATTHDQATTDAATEPTSSGETLPQTAGNQPMIALLALLALGGAALLAARRRSHAG
jgi:LPXTG-motif cell wall-anchored protein